LTELANPVDSHTTFIIVIVVQAAGSESLLSDEDEDNVLYIFSIKSEKSVFSGLFSMSL